MIDEALSKLIEFVETASSIVWEAAQRQVAAQIASLWLWLGCLIVALLVWVGLVVWQAYRVVKARKTWKDYTFIATMIGIFAVTPSVIALLTVATELIKMTNNPMWYAIQNLRSLMP